MPPQRTPGLSILAGASVFAACCLALVLSGQTQPEQLFASPATAVRAAPTLASQYPAARSVPHSTVEDFDSDQVSDEDNSEYIMVPSKPSSVQSLGMAAICTSFILAAAGFVLKALAPSQGRPRAAEINLLEAVPGHTFMMASVAAKEKRAAKLAKKKTKASKPKKEEKAQKTEVILPPKEVHRRMRLGVLRRVKKPTKTTGRVCQLLGKVDNRQARSISFSHRRTKRLQKVNLHWRRLWWEEGQCFVRLRLSTKGIKTITRYGLHQAAIKFGLDLTKNTSGTSERKYIKYLPEKEKKFALVRDAQLRYKNAVRWAKLNDEELPQPPKQTSAPIPEQAIIAMAVSHGKKVPRLGRPADQRKALLRNLTTELIRHGRIKTTLVKAQAMRKHVDHMITLAKQGTLHDRRQALGYIYDKDLVKTLFDQVPERYADRNGGYTRIIKTLPRKGDAAKMCFIELV